MIDLLAYIPFVAPMNWLNTYWPILVLPLSFGIAMVYKAIRLDDLVVYWRAVMVMSVQIVIGMIALAAFLFVLVQWIVPLLPAE